jgi:hypothetical protein
MIGTVLAAGCAAGGGTVNVTLSEFSVALDKTAIAAGSVIFEVTNSGPDDIHEFVSSGRISIPARSPPIRPARSMRQAAAWRSRGEIEDIAVGSSDSLTLDLAAGTYVLICNIYDKDENEDHDAEGMRAAFTVN